MIAAFKGIGKVDGWELFVPPSLLSLSPSLPLPDQTLLETGIITFPVGKNKKKRATGQ